MAETLTRRQAYMVLNGLPGMGPITLNRLLALFDGDPVAVLEASPARLTEARRVGPKVAEAIRGWREHFPLEREEERLATLGGSFVTCVDDDYPRLLREIHDPPIGLYFLGGYRLADRCIAIVGSRRCTLYGQATAKKLGGELARLGFCVVSGLARGIDTAAHQGALEAGGRTAAIVGCGLDIIYPPENYDLYRAIAEKGAVVSEFPFGRRADKQSFPIRNRVVAGLCEAIIVVETDTSGGAMITARFAGDMGRQVFAVPGRIDQPSSRGCHQLIRDGATLLTSVDDVLEELNYLGGFRAAAVAPAAGDRPEPAGLSVEEAAVWECFRGGSVLTIDTLSALTGHGVPELSAALMMLELKKLVRKKADGSFELAG
ncbi:MAG: DNA-protecting protein DprA [Opitutaceae bacterium]|nr:DNA-protecting protein DprA [Opitutaceae bacterium]